MSYSHINRIAEALNLTAAQKVALDAVLSAQAASKSATTIPGASKVALNIHLTAGTSLRDGAKETTGHKGIKVLFTTLVCFLVVVTLAAAQEATFPGASGARSETVSVLVGSPNRTDRAARPARAEDLSALRASLVEEYEAFSVVRVPAAALEASRGEAMRRGLRFEAHPEWDRVELPHATLTAGADLTDDVGLWVVKFVGPERSSWGERLSEYGLKYIQYHAHHAAVVYGDAAAVRRLGGERFVEWVAPYTAAAKMQPMGCADGDVFTVQLVNVPETAGLVNRLQSYAVRRDVSYGPYRNMDVALPCWQMTSILTEGTVMGVETRGTWVDSGERESIGVTTILTIAGPPTADTTVRDPWQSRWSGGTAGYFMRPRRSANATSSPSYTSWLNTKGVLSSTSFKIAIADFGLDGGNGNTIHGDLACYDRDTSGNCIGNRPITWKSFVPDNSTNDEKGHGTGVASIAVGYGWLREPIADDLSQRFTLGLGVGPRLSLHIQKIATYDNGFTNTPVMETILADAKTANAFAQTQSRNEMSLSDALITAGIYRTLDQEYDFAIKKVNLPMTISAGNIYASGTGDKKRLEVISPALAKNVITVGGSESVRSSPPTDSDCTNPVTQNISVPADWRRAVSSHDIAFLSRRGTASGDGRIKPEIVAPSTLVTVARNKSNTYSYFCKTGYGPSTDADYQLSSGTSFASPQAAAAIALINMKQGRTAGTTPATDTRFTAAMMKAALVGGAFSIKGGKDQKTGQTIKAIPDITTGQGFGRLYLDYLLDTGWRKTYVDEGAMLNFTDSGQQRSRTFTIANQSKKTVVVLAWSDFAAAAGSPSPALTRDLDLEVFLTNCASMWGNKMDPNTEVTPKGCFPPITDAKNNVEVIVIAPNSGTSFTVYVTSKNLGSSRPWMPSHVTDATQPYAIFTLNAY